MVGHARDQSALTSPHQPGLREPRGTRGNAPQEGSRTPEAGRPVYEVAVYPASSSGSSLRHFRIVYAGQSRRPARSPQHESISRVVDLTAFAATWLQKPHLADLSRPRGA